MKLKKRIITLGLVVILTMLRKRTIVRTIN